MLIVTRSFLRVLNLMISVLIVVRQVIIGLVVLKLERITKIVLRKLGSVNSAVR